MAYEIKTKKRNASVSRFLAGVSDSEKRKDCESLRKIMKAATGDAGAMWGTSIVGFGTWHYQGKSSSGEWFLVGFSPRKQNLTVYLSKGFAEQKELLKKLGPHKAGMGCLYLKRLSDIDLKVLEQMIKKAVSQK
jgi:hypothetical protein